MARFLDKAATVDEGDLLESGMPKPWRLSTVHRVEELKSLVRMLPIWASGILLATATANNVTFSLQQASSMDRQLSPSFQIPPATMHVFSTIAMLVSLVFYDRVFVPISRRFTGHPAGISYLQRMGIGLAIMALTNVVAALVEVKRKAVAADHGLLDSPHAIVPLSVFWLVPQHAASGLAEAFMSVGHLEFLYDQSPESMRSTASALYWLSKSIGNYLATFLVTLVQDFTSSDKGGGWLQDNLNRGKLDYYYWLVTGLQVLNLVYYLVCAKLFTFKPLEIAAPPVYPLKVGIDEGDVELGVNGRDTSEASRDSPGRIITGHA